MAAHSAKQKLIVTCPEDAAEYAFPRFKYEEREHFAVILMNIKNHILSMPVISIGSLTASVVHPREVFKAAIQDIPVLDHIILGNNKYISLKEKGVIK